MLTAQHHGRTTQDARQYSEGLRWDEGVAPSEPSAGNRAPPAVVAQMPPGNADLRMDQGEEGSHSRGGTWIACTSWGTSWGHLVAVPLNIST